MQYEEKQLAHEEENIYYVDCIIHFQSNSLFKSTSSPPEILL